MTKIVLCYIISLLLSAGGILGGIFYIKRVLKSAIRWSSFFIGIISAVATFVVIVLLFKLTFSNENYYNTTLFRTMVGLLYLALICLLRFFIVKAAFFNNYKEEKGHSFNLGFGAAPLAFLGFYVLIMGLVVAGNCIFNGPCMINDGYLSFADNTIISIFQPVAGHVSFSLMSLFYMVIVMSVDRYMDKLSTGRYRSAAAVIWCILLILLEGGSILLIPFIMMFGLAHWQLPIITGIIGLVCVLLAIFLPKKKQQNTTYIKQFE